MRRMPENAKFCEGEHCEDLVGLGCAVRERGGAEEFLPTFEATVSREGEWALVNCTAHAVETSLAVL